MSGHPPEAWEDQSGEPPAHPPTPPGQPDSAFGAPLEDEQTRIVQSPLHAEAHAPVHGAPPDDEPAPVLQGPPQTEEPAPAHTYGEPIEDEPAPIPQAPSYAEEHPPAQTYGEPPDDEPTRILQPPPGAEEHAPAQTYGEPPEDEQTRILQAPPYAEEHPPAQTYGEPPEDEQTRILQAPPYAEEHPAAQTYGEPPEDEQTRILQAPPHAEEHPPAHGYGEIPDDEQTRILAAPAQGYGEPLDDEQTRVLPSPPQGSPAGTMPAEPAGIKEATTILVAPQERLAPQDSTEIMRAVAPAGLREGSWPGGSATGRAWFDARLADFTGALLYDQAGERRPPQDRRALGAAARDMIERVALREAPPPESALQDATLQPGQLLINTYFVRALIARGGVGEIYRARHRDLKTDHAIKILLPRFALDATVLSLMLEEARLLALVRHEAVVGCQGLLRDSDGRPMLVMTYLRGGTLSARLRDGPLNPADLSLLAQRLAGGLAAIHDQGVVHQDISPDNIILADTSAVGATIIDFGLARSLGDGGSAHRSIDFAGKFSWCSPEQLTGRPGEVDARSDLYSLGLVLAAAGLGYRLEMGNDLPSARAARQSVPLVPGIAEPVAGVIRKLLAPSPGGRPASAREVLGMLTAKPKSIWSLLFGKG